MVTGMAWRGVARCATSYIADPERSCIARARDAAGRKSKELYYVLGVSSRGGGLWRESQPVRACASALSLSSSSLLMAATLLNTLLRIAFAAIVSNLRTLLTLSARSFVEFPCGFLRISQAFS